MEQAKYYEDKGLYRICWNGPEGEQVYVAWFAIKEKQYQPIAYFRPRDGGTDESRHEAAKAACSEHWRRRQGVSDGGNCASGND